MAEENKEESNAKSEISDLKAEAAAVGNEGGNGKSADTKRPHRSQKVGVITSDKMQKTVVVRVDRLVRHTKYRRYVRRTSKFMAHDELGATIGDKVRIVETRPLSARKRWRVVEIVQKAAK
jgi:small subunit ribosomal protein S17